MIKSGKNKLLPVIVCVVLIAAMALCMTGCGSKTNPPAAEPSPEAAETAFTFVVVDANGGESSFDITTDKATVGEALLDEGLIEGEDSEYGLYVTTVNGITCDWDADQTYWAFYIDGEYATTGVDSTPVTSGATYSFVVEGAAADGGDTEGGENVLGEGAVSFSFVVVDVEGNETCYTVNTDETTVGAALLKVGIIDGEDSEYGLYVTTVDGVTLDWEKDQKYWAFYIDGEYATTGVDLTDINPGSTYMLKAE